MKTETFQTIATAAHKTTYAGAAGGFWGWLTSNATLGLIGTLIALCGLAINTYYRRKADRRASQESALRQQESQLRISLLQNQLQDSQYEQPATPTQILP